MDAVEFPPNMTLDEARVRLRGLARSGHDCPVCSQLVKVYKRKLNSGIARALIVMWRAGRTDWIHKPTVLKGLGSAARDESIARYWGLIEEEVALRPDGGRSGWWRITPDGEKFVAAIKTVPKYALIYDGRCLGHEGEQVSIHDCLGDRFNYGELMTA